MTPERLAQLRAAATRPRRTVPILLDGDVRGRVEVLEVELDDIDARAAGAEMDRRLASRKRVDDPRRVEALAELDQLHAAAADSTLHVVVEGLASTVYRALLAEHPPRTGPDGKIHPDDRIGANEDTLRPALVRACVVGQLVDEELQPLDVDTVEWLIDWASDAQMDRLSVAAYAVNRGDDAIPLPRTRSATLTSEGA